MSKLSIGALCAFWAGFGYAALAEAQTVPMKLLQNQIVVGRDQKLGHLSIEQNGRRLAINDANLPNLYPQGAFNFGEKNYVVVYDAGANVPSGRKLTRGTEENDLYELELGGDAVRLKRVAELPQGIDISVLTATLGNGVAVCGQTACLHLTSSGATPIKLPSGQLIELASDQKSLFGLFQKEYDDQLGAPPTAATPIFIVCALAVGQNPTCQDRAADEIPYRLQVVSGKPTLRSARTRQDLDDLFRFDMTRARGSGTANLMEPNLEARIAWSNVYYVNGLSSVVSGRAAKFTSEQTVSDLRARLAIELDALKRRVNEDYPGLLVRRYSPNREAVSFLLHQSRVARTMIRAGQALGASDPIAAAEPLIESIKDPRTTIEYVADAAGKYELRYHKGQPFWADGVNTPWNFQSGWIEALGYSNLLSDERLKSIASSMIEQFIRSEKLTELPQKWNYAGGDMQRGWTEEEKLSTNTPSWAGQRSITQTAHISYRSMDAMALLAADKSGINIGIGIKSYFSTLIMGGYLYPFVRESLDTPVNIPRHIARHYARATLPWHVQNQVWALDALVED